MSTKNPLLFSLLLSLSLFSFVQLLLFPASYEPNFCTLNFFQISRHSISFPFSTSIFTALSLELLVCPKGDCAQGCLTYERLRETAFETNIWNSWFQIGKKIRRFWLKFRVFRILLQYFSSFYINGFRIDMSGMY